MTKREYRYNAYLVLYLVNCALHDRSAVEKTKKMDLSSVYAVAEKHMLLSIIAYGLESLGIQDIRFIKAKAKSIRNSIVFDMERDKILKELEKHKIWYMPLKGIVLKKYYPVIGMRQMCDNDILFNNTHVETLKSIMFNLGFKMVHDDSGHDLEFIKKPVCNFEMHTRLFGVGHDETYNQYYKNVKLRLLKDVDNKYGFHFSDEDFYIFMTAHEYKHYRYGGTGLRSLVDAYVFLNKFLGKLDMEYIDKELKKLGIFEYEHKRRQLVFDIFDKGRIDSNQKKLLDYYIFSGAYGNIENRVKNSVDKNFFSKTKYIMKRVFPPLSSIKNSYSFFYNHKYLIPFIYVYRLVLAITKRRKRVLSEILALIW